MKPEKVYLAWAPANSIPSPWVIPVPFAQIVCITLSAESELAGLQSLAGGLMPTPDLAVVLDLPEKISARMGLALPSRGFRPVPVIDGSPGPDILGTMKGALLFDPTAVATGNDRGGHAAIDAMALHPSGGPAVI